jgi:acyl carrier protein
MTIDRDALLSQLTQYIKEELVEPEVARELTATTPLLEWGVLDSMKVARLIGYLRDEHGVRVPPASMTGGNFRDLDSIANLAVELAVATP